MSDFATIAKPLNTLTGQNVKSLWNIQAEEAFIQLKITAPPILKFPHPNSQFVQDTDASNVRVGAALFQLKDGTERVIAYCT